MIITIQVVNQLMIVDLLITITNSMPIEVRFMIIVIVVVVVGITVAMQALQ